MSVLEFYVTKMLFITHWNAYTMIVFLKVSYKSISSISSLNIFTEFKI